MSTRGRNEFSVRVFFGGDEEDGDDVALERSEVDGAAVVVDIDTAVVRSAGRAQARTDGRNFADAAADQEERAFRTVTASGDFTV